MDLSPPSRDGHVVAAWANPRPEVTALVPYGCRDVLDLGCSTGLLGRTLRDRGAHVCGVEIDPGLAAEAATRLDTVVVDDVERLAAAGGPLPGGPFDCVVMADVLEHLRNPWDVVRWAATLILPGGCLVVSVPNVRHLQLLWHVGVRGRWPYREIGIFDRTHLRFFARDNLADLLDGTGFSIVELRRSHWLTYGTGRVNRYARYLGDLGTQQFVFRAERAGASV